MTKTPTDKIYEMWKKSKNKLSDRESLIITKYYGLDHNFRHTLTEIGNTLDLTKERIRQIKANAIKKLEE